jgi:hypothetical protein
VPTNEFRLYKRCPSPLSSRDFPSSFINFLGFAAFAAMLHFDTRLLFPLSHRWTTTVSLSTFKVCMVSRSIILMSLTELQVISPFGTSELLPSHHQINYITESTNKSIHINKST